MLKNKLLNNELSVGSWITIGHNSIAEIMANSGFDWLVVDLEHSTINIETAGELIRTIDLCGITPLVRLTSNDSNQIKRVMDAGAHGIVVPMVNTVEQARTAVAATRYAPKGTRGVGLARAQKYGNSFEDYLEWQKDNPVVIVQIEHIEAIEVLEDILTVPGVDGFIIGPYDLSCSMGIPGDFKNSKFIETMHYICETGKKLGCSAGLHIVEPDTKLLKSTIEEGYTFIAYSVDIRMLDISAREGLSVIDRVLG
jgi:2-keto-3-deoxy-L-rhamnonate aldolase RhmA